MKPIPFKWACLGQPVYGLNISASEYRPEGIRFIRTTDINDFGGLKSDGAVYLDEKYWKDGFLENGDILLSRSGTLGRVLLFDEKHYGKCAHAGYLVRFRLSKENTPRFFLYQFMSKDFQEWIKTDSIESTIGNINGQKYANYRFFWPDPSHQTAIADFLDRETARIDGLIAQEERLLALLEEKRTALISHAVTKGLDPNAELKDSGIEWLGQIPKDWEVKKLKYCSKQIKTGGTPPAEYIVPEGELDWYTPGDFDGSLFLGSSKRRLSAGAFDDKVFRFFPEGSILIVGIGATLGKVALTNKRCSANQQINFVVPSFECSPEFLVYFLSLHRETMRLLSDSATLGIMNQEKTGILPIPCPAKELQEEIVAYVKTQTARFDALKTKITRAIELLREKRTALISAAVTGKIDLKEGTKL